MAARKKPAPAKAAKRNVTPARAGARVMVTQAAYAKHRGVTPECVRQWRDRGRLVTEGEGRALRVDVEASDRRIARYRDPQQDAAMRRRGEFDDDAQAETDDSLDEAKRRKAWSDARKAEVELARLEGTLIDRAMVRRAVADLAARLKSTLTNLPARSSATLAARLGADEHEVYLALDELVRDVLDRQRRMALRLRAQSDQVPVDEELDDDQEGDDAVA